MTHRLLQVIVFLALLAWRSSTLCPAQSCSGVLGEAIINETFGSSAAGPIFSGATTYRLIPGGCPDDGQYAITNGVYAACYNNTWHEVTQDHTPGDADGNMFIVNASYEAGEFYKQSVPGLCVGTTYEFSVWVINVLNPTVPNNCTTSPPRDPDITMRIETPDGRVLQTINTGLIARSATPTWLRYAVLFTMPVNVSTVVVKLVNNGLGGCGNDLALDDIQFRPCTPPLQIQFSNQPGGELSLCENTPISIRSSLGTGFADPVYLWQESPDSLSWTDIPNAEGPQYNLTTRGAGRTFYRLLCIQGESRTAIRNTRCRAVSNVLSVTILPDCKVPQLYVPEVFTPNGDGINDLFQLLTTDVALVELTVFDRWGNVIFSNGSAAPVWDGTYRNSACPSGVYAWKISFQGVDQGSNGQRYTRRGSVVLWR